MLKKEFNDLTKTSYLDFFFLEDDKWGTFLVSYLASIEEAIEQQREKIDDKMLNEVIELFAEGGIKREQLDGQFKGKLREFFLKESRWLTIEMLVGVFRNFWEGRKEGAF